MFITFEGIDGCGKSTQLALFAHYLRKKGCAITVTREPGGTRVAEKIRNIILDAKNAHLSPMAELMLYCAARAQHVAQIIRPALHKGRIVLSDRFSDSTLAYQGGGRGLLKTKIETLNNAACDGAKPDLTMLFDIPATEAFRRMRASGRRPDRMEKEGVAFLEKARRAYLRLAKKEPRRIKVLDGTRSINALAQAVAAIFDSQRMS